MKKNLYKIAGNCISITFISPVKYYNKSIYDLLDQFLVRSIYQVDVSLKLKFYSRNSNFYSKTPLCKIRSLNEKVHFWHKGAVGEVLDVHAEIIQANFILPPNAQTVSDVIKLVSTYGFIKKGKILTHSSCVGWDNRALLFLAKPESGKTTIAKLLCCNQRIKFLHPDNNIIDTKAGNYIAQPWPFLTGAIFKNYSIKLPIAALIFLDGWGRNKLRRLESQEAFNKLLDNSFKSPFNEKMMMDFVAYVDNFSRNLPCYCLSFQKNDSIVSFLGDALGLPY